MKNIKSVTTVRYFGNAAQPGSWAARIRYADGRELYAGIGAGYNLHQAQALIRNNHGNYESLNLIALPTDVKVRAA